MFRYAVVNLRKKLCVTVSNAVTWANDEYVRMVNNERKRAHEEEVKRRKAELDRADKNAKFSRDINEMLAQL